VNSDARKAEWLQMRRSTWSGFTGLTNKMIDSEAFQALRSVHSVKALIYFWQLAEYPRGKRKPGQESPVGNLSKILNQAKISFEYRIAGYRGLRLDQFSRALKELFRYGFIDFSRHGRGVMGEYSKFSLSDRWKKYGTPAWEEIPFPTSDRAGFTSDEFKKKRRERRGREKNSYGKAELLTTKSRSYFPLESPPLLRKRVVNNDRLRPSVATDSRSLLRSFHAYKDSEGTEKKVFDPELKAHRTVAAIRRDAIPIWPDQWHVLDLSNKLLLDSTKEFGDGDHPHRDELTKALRLVGALNRLTGCEATQ